MEFVYHKKKNTQNLKICVLSAEFFWLAFFFFSANKIDSLPWCMFVTVWVITSKIIIKPDYTYLWHLALARSGILIYEYLQV